MCWKPDKHIKGDTVKFAIGFGSILFYDNSEDVKKIRNQELRNSGTHKEFLGISRNS